MVSFSMPREISRGGGGCGTGSSMQSQINRCTVHSGTPHLVHQCQRQRVTQPLALNQAAQGAVKLLQQLNLTAPDSGSNGSSVQLRPRAGRDRD